MAQMVGAKQLHNLFNIMQLFVYRRQSRRLAYVETMTVYIRRLAYIVTMTVYLRRLAHVVS